MIYLSFLKKFKDLYRNLSFFFDYYISYFMYNGNNINRWETHVKTKYPEKFKQNK